MPDVARIGGVSGWMQAAAIAEAHGIPMSSHLMPEVSAHLLAATPTAHWLEYVDWTDAIAADPVKIAGGCWPIPERPGTGLAWDAAGRGASPDPMNRTLSLARRHGPAAAAFVPNSSA
jgi:mandelate racemase